MARIAETLEPGEWGPFEELAAAAAEILRLRALLRCSGRDPEDPAGVPAGHLVYQPEAADAERGRAHRTVLVEQAGQSAEIDVAIAPLLAEVWTSGIRTLHSCEDNPKGYVWIEFDTVEDARRFVQVALGPVEPRHADPFGLQPRALREGPAAFWPLSRKLWLYKVMPTRRAKDQTPRVDFLVSVRFPHEDLPEVLERFRKHNAAV
jgi:hypothetical protein